MAKGELLTPDGQPFKREPQPPKQEPVKQKPKDVNIKDIDSLQTISSMGQPGIVLFGLGDDNQVYVWNVKERVWLEH